MHNENRHKTDENPSPLAIICLLYSNMPISNATKITGIQLQVESGFFCDSKKMRERKKFQQKQEKTPICIRVCILYSSLTIPSHSIQSMFDALIFHC